MRLMSLRLASWALTTRWRNLSVACASVRRRLMMMFSHATPRFLRPLTRRSDSAAASAVAMETTTNWVRSVSRRSCLSSTAFARVLSNAATASSMSSLPASPDAKLAIPKSVFAALMAPSSFFLIVITFCRNESRKSGNDSSRSVWPVGAVSTTMRWKSPFLAMSSTFPSATTSSMPGGGFSRRSANSSKPIFDANSPSLLFMLETPRSFSLNSSNAFSVSTSIANRLPSVPSTIAGEPESFMLRQSPRECAGSVEMRRVLTPSSASFTPSALLVLVFPTPPFPPTNTNCTSLAVSVSNSFPYCPFAMWSGPKAAAPNARSPYTPTISVSNSGTLVMWSGETCGDDWRYLRVRSWSLVMRCRYASDSVSLRSSWLTTMWRSATLLSRSLVANRPLSADDKPVAMHTITNSDRSGSCKSESKSSIRSRNLIATSFAFAPPCLMLSLDGILIPSCDAMNDPA
mmetsp:Transcript_87135/g.130700  ORF Transcript_87135/g.130700 Transcript_87135/m.130700 type:complete len:460 (-) Transcript_87135:949-2328(-)